MTQILGVILLSFATISVLLVPAINYLYKLKFLRRLQKTRDVFHVPTPIFDRLHSHKAGTPVGGGALIIFVVTVLYLALITLFPRIGFERTAVYPYKKEVQILLFTFISFGRKSIWGLRFRHKFIVQWLLAFAIAAFLYFQLGIDIVNVTFLDIFDLGILYIPFAAFVIVSFANAVNISDGLDGLASGLLLICLMAFLVMSASILDTTLSIFLGLWIGAIIGFLYFNVWPARVWLGDVGALSFGATLAVCGLLLGKPIALAIIGGVFVIEVASSLLQLLSKSIRHKKIFEVSPIHLWLQNKGWQEPKIVFRFWLAQVIFATFGLWLSYF